MNRAVLFLVLLIIVRPPASASCEILKSNTVWSGEVFVKEDVLIPEGVVLTVLPGTKVHITPADSTRTDPEYMTSLTELTVRGVLRAGNKGGQPVVFDTDAGGKTDGWAGILVDGGSLELNSCTVRNAESGVYVLKGTAVIRDSVLEKNRYGLSVQGAGARVKVEDTAVLENDYGTVLLNGARLEGGNNVVRQNRKKDSYLESRTGGYSAPAREYRSDRKIKGGVYGDEVLLGTTIWEGLVSVNGLVRVPEKSRLIIMPGTVVEFRKKDTNNDGIGENGLLIQGLLIAKGTTDKPIVIRSAERPGRMGDWDAINIMNSDGAQNIIEYCQIEDAYRGLHLHFSNVAVKNSVLRNNYRGVQFQESFAEIGGSYFYGNKSGLQARDSEMVFTDNDVFDNYFGLYIYRVNGAFRGNRITANYREGFRVREGMPVVEENFIDGNRYGLSLSYSVYGGFSRNVISNNSESGLALKGADNITIENNFIQGNGLNGISVLDSRAVIRGNHISKNGDRGIGIVSFDGLISENSFFRNGLYAIGLDGGMNINAPLNWWGGAAIEDVLYDANDEPRRGRISYREPAAAPLPFLWPLKSIYTDTEWYGEIRVRGNPTVVQTAGLRIFPGTKVVFAKDAALTVKGRIEAKGERDARIVFTALEKRNDALWDEMLLEQAKGVFSSCDFEYAAMAIHSHFSNLSITGCRFRSNTVGMAFRGGPVAVSRSLYEGNSTGLRPFFANAVITENVITKNEIGIFVREEKAKGLSIRRNNIFGNFNYNMRLGDFNRDPVDAKENWWGEGTPSAMIYDEEDEPEIGKAIYEPYAPEPFRLDAGGTN